MLSTTRIIDNDVTQSAYSIEPFILFYEHMLIDNEEPLAEQLEIEDIDLPV